MSVTLYTVGCPKCLVLEAKLKQKGINFVENNNVEEMIKLNFINVPVLLADGKIMEYKEAIKWVKEQ